MQKNSCLMSLNPDINEVGILSEGGHLRHSKLKDKHPMIIGSKNNLTLLNIADAHSGTYALSIGF